MDYRGELGIILINLSNTRQIIEHSDRVAQIVLMKSSKIEWSLAEELEETDRNSEGFGTTGVK